MAKEKKPISKVKTMTLKNCEGKIKRLPLDATIKELREKYGLRAIRLESPDKPRPRGKKWYYYPW